MGLGGWGRENATVSRINRGTRGVGEGECHSEQDKPWD